jgi:hypothetical protein
LYGIWKEAVLVQFDVLFQHLPGATKENLSQDSGCPGLRIKLLGKMLSEKGNKLLKCETEERKAFSFEEPNRHFNLKPQKRNTSTLLNAQVLIYIFFILFEALRFGIIGEKSHFDKVHFRKQAERTAEVARCLATANVMSGWTRKNAPKAS